MIFNRSVGLCHHTVILERVKSFPIFCALIWCCCPSCGKIPVVFGSISIVSALVRCALRYSVGDMKVTKMNEQLILDEFELSYNVPEANINIWCVKVESQKTKGNPWGVVSKVLECDIIVSKFKLHSPYIVHFRTNIYGKGMNSLIIPVIGLVEPLLFFYKDAFDLKWPTKVDMPWNKGM